MTQLSSSLRAARAALKHPPTIWQNRTQQTFPLLCRDAVVSKMSHHGLAVSTRAISSTATSSSFAEMMGRAHVLSATSPLHDKFIMYPRPFNETVKNAMSTSTSSQDNNGAINNLSELNTETTASIPFKRSKKTKPKFESSGFDDRAIAKLTALSEAKKEAEDAKAAFLSSTSADDADSNAGELHEKWNQSEKNLALAYSQAIKYTSRITKNEKATRAAERRLYEWMDRFMDPFGGSSVWMKENEDKKNSSDLPGTMHLNKKWMVKTIHTIMPKLTKESKVQDGAAVSTTLPKIRIPPPTSKDYINLLRAYSVSKARRKGQQCEALMKNMMRLANTVSYHYDEDNGKWTDDMACDVGMESVSGEGKETKKWRSWVNESIPNSKAFALAIKCHAGSTHSESLERIILLNHIHDSFSDCCQSHIPGMYKDDPYVLFHSIKALKNLQKKEEWELGHGCLTKLHRFVTSSKNKDYFQQQGGAGEVEGAKDESKELDQTGEAPAANSQTIDVTSVYTTMIRLMARLRGKNDVAADARKVLDNMQIVHDVYVNGLETPESEMTITDGTSDGDSADKLISKDRIASIDIRSNAYNLVLGLYRDSKSARDTTKAIELLQRMVDAGKKAPEDRGGVPLPTEQSFEFTIMSLANMSDGEKALEEAERLIELMQDKEYLESSVAAYNAYIIVCNRQLFGKKAQLYDKALDILNKMKEMSKTNPGVSPSPETLALVMKAFSLSDHDDHEKVIDTASDIFFQLKEQETSEKSAVALTDRAYFYMMKCVDRHLVEDPAKKKELIEEFFSEACQRGLCSANILSLFRQSVSKEDFHLTVGEGRLADHWISNIKGPRALYTDGSKGGAGKHANRKGKSTSNWVKKKNAKDSQRETRKKDKKAKKFFKKVKA
mmetsp:Transcript_28208/g.60102  ORF Transcript_28208/g.60102 Transcript_28208/m.60102 type:complete len:895 (+) Transcript_28208:112-2796(+)|eukprot:CAMPEP_0172320704 /NCGR_PEP_ID=MMETSP1058-20130122/41210_1 /TAXON_ID=83371 /ORGANISM="Detonula confervacea, Strain CCMP 353" /LENGTH=894 /DNA_ID=CAMNT_0013036021 /DNA_START=99 /DNA_END=2783 /DNA_ORIENTATION=-